MELREPVSFWTHALWLLLTVPATLVLLRASRHQPLKQFAFLVYGVCLGCCFLGSMLYHGVRVERPEIGWFVTLDYIGIFLLIAGTVTPIALVVLRGPWRVGLLTAIWLLAGIGIGLRLGGVPLSRLASTCIYLGMGWAAVLCYFELIRLLSPRSFDLVVLGGVLYSCGAILNHAQWPVLWPGVFSAHEVLHLFVMAASLCHFLFMLRVIAPYKPRTSEGSSVRVHPEVEQQASGATSGRR